MIYDCIYFFIYYLITFTYINSRCDIISDFTALNGRKNNELLMKYV
jgi:hypothetical protein